MSSFKIPSTCPCCSSQLVREGAHYFCYNDNCHDQVVQRLRHALGKGALDWDGAGEKMIEALVAAGCNKLSDVLKFDPNKSPFFGTAGRVKFISERDRVKTAPMWRKILALGIELVGATSSKDLCKTYPEGILQMIDAGETGLTKVLGPVAANNFLKFCSRFTPEIAELDELGYSFVAEKNLSEEHGIHTPLSGKTFCLTGSMESGTRPAVAARIEAAGGTVKGGVSKDVQYLVSGPGAGDSKAKAAAKYGTAVITEQDLFKMAGWTFQAATKPSIDEW